jgi:hypothetical protein
MTFLDMEYKLYQPLHQLGCTKPYSRDKNLFIALSTFLLNRPFFLAHRLDRIKTSLGIQILFQVQNKNHQILSLHAD